MKEARMIRIRSGRIAVFPAIRKPFSIRKAAIAERIQLLKYVRFVSSGCHLSPEAVGWRTDAAVAVRNPP